MIRQLAGWLVLLVAITGMAGGLGYLKYQQIQAGIAAGKAYPEPVQAVGSTMSTTGTWTPTTRAIGTIVALRQVDLRNEIAGVVTEVGFQSGSEVKAGQMLLKLDTRQEEASLAAAEAEARLARTTLDRRQSLKGSPAFSEQELDRAREEQAAASARAKSLSVAIDRKQIRAPFDGRVGITDLQPGAYLDAGARITSLQGTSNDAFVDFFLPQDSAAMIRKGIRVKLVNDAIPGGEAEAEIAAEDNAADRTSRTILFRAVAQGLGSVLRPGMYIDVIAVTAPAREAVVVPLTSLRRSAEGAHVFVVHADDSGKLRAHQRRVVLGPVVNDDVFLLDGLKSGERIATTGSFKLREGALVATDPAPTTATEPAVN